MSSQYGNHTQADHSQDEKTSLGVFRVLSFDIDYPRSPVVHAPLEVSHRGGNMVLEFAGLHTCLSAPKPLVLARGESHVLMF